MNTHAKFTSSIDMFRINGLLMDLLDPRGLTYDADAALELVRGLPVTHSLKFENFKSPSINTSEDHVMQVGSSGSRGRNADEEWQIRHDRCSQPYYAGGEDIMGAFYISTLGDEGKSPLRHALHYTANTFGNGSVSLGPLITRQQPSLMPWLPELLWPLRSTRLPGSRNAIAQVPGCVTLQLKPAI